MLGRRAFLAGAAAGAASWIAAPRLAAAPPLPPPLPSEPGGTVALELQAAERLVRLPCFPATLPLWTFRADDPAPVVRLRLGDTLAARVENALPRPGEHITIHWHGIRLPNDQDGVPYLTQAPIDPGGAFEYRFTPPDTGTFFFHTHCNTAEQLGRGLLGVLVVEGDETTPYDGDEVIVLRDWRLAESGAFLPFTTDSGAARAGTFGTVRSANGQVEPTLAVPASADIRLRVLNADVSRVMEFGIEGAEAAIVATDGLALPPVPLRSWRMGPATRLDIIVRTPAAGGTARLVDYFAPEPVTLAQLASEGPERRRTPFDPAPLRASRLPEPDLRNAERIPFSFSATPSGAAQAESPFGGDLCTPTRAFWAINKVAWPGADHRQLPPPLVTLQGGRTYLFELHNSTPQQHPIHLHGHSFKVLRSSKRNLPEHWADTVLLLPKERAEIAFVADNPGDWMFHCHIVEHQDTGMMAYLRVA